MQIAAEIALFSYAQIVHKFLCSFANFLIRLRESEEGGLWLKTVIFGLICGVTDGSFSTNGIT